MQDADFDRNMARADLCRFLAGCHYQPGPEFAEERLFESIADAAARVDPGLARAARRLGDAFAAEGHERLLIEYTRLFLGPTGAIAPPYGSVWLENAGSLAQPSTVAVAELYAAAGFEMDEQFRDLPDHVAAELEFLYRLLFRESEACLKADEPGLQSTTALRRRFLAQHLGRWIGPFTRAIENGTDSDFYRALAALTRDYVEGQAGG